MHITISEDKYDVTYFYSNSYAWDIIINKNEKDKKYPRENLHEHNYFRNWLDLSMHINELNKILIELEVNHGL